MTLVCFALFFAGIVLCLVLDASLIPALLLGVALFSLLGLRKGFSPKALASMAWEKGRDSLVVIPVFLLIGVVMGLWRSAGTISYFLYYGLLSISPRIFLLVVFLLSAALSFVLGTSFGVTGTAGVVLITLARSGGVDLAMTAGAILSGAYFGDRCSPMSSCATLVAAVTDTKLYDNVREMLKTGALPTALTLVFYGVLSVRNPITSVDTAVLSALSEGNALHWLALLPAVLMLLLPLLKIPVKWAMAVSAATAFVLSVVLQQMSFAAALRTAIFGYAPTSEALAGILSGGGLLSMFSSSAIVFLTSLYAGILEGIGILIPAKALVERLASRVGLFPTSIFVSTAIGMAFCNQTVVTLINSQLLPDSYHKRGASNTELAMDLANSGVMISGLIPWNIAASIPLAMLDVGSEAILWASLLYFTPLCYLFTKRYFRSGQNRPLSLERT